MDGSRVKTQGAAIRRSQAVQSVCLRRNTKNLIEVVFPQLCSHRKNQRRISRVDFLDPRLRAFREFRFQLTPKLVIAQKSAFAVTAEIVTFLHPAFFRDLFAITKARRDPLGQGVTFPSPVA
jgi:hypothetical protein